MADGCRGAVLFCIDHRFHQHLGDLIAGLGWDEGGADIIRIAGGARSLARPRHPRDREFILEQLCAAHQGHGVRHFALVNHEDCGAYGQEFVADSEDELAVHHQDLREARRVVLEAFEDVQVDVRLLRVSGALDAVSS